MWRGPRLESDTLSTVRRIRGRQRTRARAEGVAGLTVLVLHMGCNMLQVQINVIYLHSIFDIRFKRKIELSSRRASSERVRSRKYYHNIEFIKHNCILVFKGKFSGKTTRTWDLTTPCVWGPVISYRHVINKKVKNTILNYYLILFCYHITKCQTIHF